MGLKDAPRRYVSGTLERLPPTVTMPSWRSAPLKDSGKNSRQPNAIQEATRQKNVELCCTRHERLRISSRTAMYRPALITTQAGKAHRETATKTDGTYHILQASLACSSSHHPALAPP